MRYMIDTRTISKERPSPQQVKLNMWKLKEMEIIGLMTPYCSDNKQLSKRKKLTQFKSYEEYGKALAYAAGLLDEYKQIPEPLRTKLIKEADNLKTCNIQ